MPRSSNTRARRSSRSSSLSASWAWSMLPPPGDRYFLEGRGSGNRPPMGSRGRGAFSDDWRAGFCPHRRPDGRGKSPGKSRLKSARTGRVERIGEAPGCPKPRRSAPRVASHLLFGGLDNGARQTLPRLGIPKGLLHEPVFERMERDHHHPPAGGEPSGRALQRDLQTLQLLVDRDPERLEGACRRMDPGRRILAGNR